MTRTKDRKPRDESVEFEDEKRYLKSLKEKKKRKPIRELDAEDDWFFWNELTPKEEQND